MWGKSRVQMETPFYSSETFAHEDYLVYLRIYVSSESKTLVEIVMTASVSLLDKISNVGGTIGLFTGFSILSAVEILYWTGRYYCNTNRESGGMEFCLQLLLRYCINKRRDSAKVCHESTDDNGEGCCCCSPEEISRVEKSFGEIGRKIAELAELKKLQEEPLTRSSRPLP